MCHRSLWHELRDQFNCLQKHDQQNSNVWFFYHTPTKCQRTWRMALSRSVDNWRKQNLCLWWMTMMVGIDWTEPNLDTVWLFINRKPIKKVDVTLMKDGLNDDMPCAAMRAFFGNASPRREANIMCYKSHDRNAIEARTVRFNSGRSMCIYMVTNISLVAPETRHSFTYNPWLHNLNFPAW
jgi:hypothetical protein